MCFFIDRQALENALAALGRNLGTGTVCGC